MRPRLGEVLHFSEDPLITEFVPHVARTATDQTPYVWAVDAVRAPDYWFPRDCPRAMAWSTPSTTEADRLLILGPSARRVHMIEYEWLQRVQTTEVFAYRFDAGDFEPYGHPADPHAYVARHQVRPMNPPEPVGDLLTLHRQAGIEVRLVDSLWPWWTAVTTTSVGFTGIRLGNPRDASSRPPS